MLNRTGRDHHGIVCQRTLSPHQAVVKASCFGTCGVGLVFERYGNVYDLGVVGERVYLLVVSDHLVYPLDVVGR